MADTPTPPDHPTPDAFDQIRAEIDAMRVSAGAADVAAADSHPGCSVHAVESVGRYAIPFDDGWQALLGLLRDPEIRIQFSPPDYPHFDRLLAGHVDDATRDAGLRDNLAAVRNFILQIYYTQTPRGMTPEKAQQSLEEIAAFVGDGLRYSMQLGSLPNRDTAQPFIDTYSASAADGAGAQYIYEKILDAHRQSGWLRPFSAIIALFGGKAPTDWMLLPGWETPFHFLNHAQLAPTALGDDPTPEEIDAAMAHLDHLEARQQALNEAMVVAATATDLDAVANHLVYTADNLPEVKAMSEPVKRDAIDIAKEILRRLKISMGAAMPEKGLVVEPGDEMADIGGLRGVAKVFERLLAWGRGIDGTIMQHPSVLTAMHALGQVGYMAKLGALRVALMNGDTLQAQQLQQDLNYIPNAYRERKEKELAALLDAIERGIDTVLNRVQTISGPGAMVGHSPTKELGSYMSGTPIAGTALQAQAEGIGKGENVRQQAAVQERANAAMRAQAQRVASQLANQRSQGSDRPPARGSASAQLNAIRQRLAQARRSATQQGTQAATRNSAARAAALNIHGHDAHDPHHHGQPGPDPMAATIAKIDPRLLNNIKQMNTMTAGLTNMAPITGRQAFDKMQKANTGGAKPPGAPQKQAAALSEEQKKKQAKEQLPPPPMPPKGGMTR